MTDASVNNTVKSTYFEPPSRLQLLDKLQHLVRYSDFLLLVTGERGSGKTTLLQQLCPPAGDDQLVSCLLSLDKPVKDRDLLPRLISQLPVHDVAGDSYSEQLHTFHKQLQALSSAGQKCLILVDNAELLTDSALDLLLNLHASSTEEQSIQLVLFADVAFAARVSENELIRHLEGRMHNLLLLGMKDEELREFLDTCVPKSARINLQKRNEIIRLSGGMPGRAMALLDNEGQQLMRRMFPLPPLHMAGISVILLAVLMLSMWQFMPESEVGDHQVADSDRVELPLPVAVKEAESDQLKELSVAPEQPVLKPVERVAEESASSSPSQVEVKQQASPEVADAADLPDQVVEAVPVLPSAEPQPEPAAQVAGKPLKPDEESATVLEKTAPVSETKVVAAVQQPEDSLPEHEKVLLKWPVKGYTLQLLGARKESSAINFIKNQPNPDEFHYFATLYKGKPWYVVIYGQYSNRDVATSAIRKLPESLQKIRPWARSVQSVHLDIKKKINQ